MIFAYGFTEGSGHEAVREYQRYFPQRRLPNRHMFGTTHHIFDKTERN